MNRLKLDVASIVLTVTSRAYINILFLKNQLSFMVKIIDIQNNNQFFLYSTFRITAHGTYLGQGPVSNRWYRILMRH